MGPGFINDVLQRNETNATLHTADTTVVNAVAIMAKKEYLYADFMVGADNNRYKKLTQELKKTTAESLMITHKRYMCNTGKLSVIKTTPTTTCGW